MSPSKVEYQPLIRDMSPSERPRERLIALGAGALRDEELLAIILRTGMVSESAVTVATRVLGDLRGIVGLLQASFSELCAKKGVGEAKACQIKAALELGKRLYFHQQEERPIVKSPQDVANLLLAEMGFLEQEELWVVLLNNRNQVIDRRQMYRGNVNTSVIRVNEIFRQAIRENSPALVVVHNHPSGDPTPSSEDIEVTKQMVAAGKLLDIDVLDHLIIGQQKFVSLKEKGLGFS